MTPDKLIAEARGKMPRPQPSSIANIERWFDPREVLERLQKGEIDWGLPAEAVSVPVNFTLAPDMSLCEALDGFLREQAATLPVTPGQWRHTLIGEVSRSDVLLAIQDRLAYQK
jgi:hypothetical protein